MTTTESRPAAATLDEIFHPRSVAVAGVSSQQPGFAGVGTGFLLSLMELGFPNLYPVNPKYPEFEGLKCYASVLDIEGPVDHVISSVPAHVVPRLVEDCIQKGVRSVHFFTAGFRETGDAELADLEKQVVGRLTGGGIRVFGPNCMGLYVPESKLAFMPGFPTESGPVGFISQSGGNAGEMVYTATVRGIRFSKVVSYGNAADVDEAELLAYLADDPNTEIICSYIEGIKDGRRFFESVRKAAAAKPTVILKGGRTAAGTRAVMSHTASLAGSLQVFDSLCRQVNAVRVNSVEEMADLAVAFRFLQPLVASPPTSVAQGPRPETLGGIAVVGGGGGFSVFAADEIDDAGLSCPVLPEHTQKALGEINPVAGTSVRNPVDTIAIWEPSKLEQTLRIIGEAENIDVILYHTSLSWGRGRRSVAVMGADPAHYMQMQIQQMEKAREASGTPIVVVLRPPLDVESMERTAAFQDKCWRAGFPIYPTIPRAANAIAKTLRWSQRRKQ
jgi:acyl-CoA synthetase (NDP forming)